MNILSLCIRVKWNLKAFCKAHLGIIKKRTTIGCIKIVVFSILTIQFFALFNYFLALLGYDSRASNAVIRLFIKSSIFFTLFLWAFNYFLWNSGNSDKVITVVMLCFCYTFNRFLSIKLDNKADTMSSYANRLNHDSWWDFV